jgi:hypothetical protein
MSDIFIDLIEGRSAAVKHAILNNLELLNARWLDDPEGESLLHKAARYGNIEIVEFLLDHGADVNFISSYDTSLCTAAENGHTEIVKLLLSRGAFVDGVDGSIMTPLMLAAREGCTEMTEILLKAGAEVNRLSHIQRRFPLDYTGWKNQPDAALVALLRSYGAISLLDDFDWDNMRGVPILSHVMDSGWVYPNSFDRDIGGEFFPIRFAKIRDKVKPLFLFSAGAYEFGQMVELGFALPGRWALLNKYRNSKSKLSFPLDVLAILLSALKHGEKICAGYIVSREDSRFSDLGWPDNISYLVLVNHSWKLAANRKLAAESKGKSPEKTLRDDEVSILTLAPVTLKNFKPTEKDIQKFVDAKWSSTWKKLLLPDPLFGDIYY